MESLSFDGHLTPLFPAREQGRPTTIQGLLRLPAGAGPFPALVIAHGCSGLVTSIHRWADELRQAGLATFVVSSFAPRNVTSTCHGSATVHVAGLVSDVYRARELLAADARIDGSRIAVLGFSMGGRTALWSGSPRFRERYGKGGRFSAHLAFYPASCFARLADEASPGEAPVRIFHGSADDWTPIAACREHVARLKSAGRDAVLFEYAGARHAFDSELTERSIPTAINLGGCRFTEVDGTLRDEAGRVASLDSPCIIRGARIGRHDAAREQASRDLREALRSLLF